MRPFILAAVTLWLLSALGCGGNSNQQTAAINSPAGNVAAVEVNSGPNKNAVNKLYTTVTVCLTGTATCQTIDNVQVDTGSYGLRILGSVLTLGLPVEKSSATGNAVAECAQSAGGYSWGPVATADVQLASEFASNIPIQVIGASGYGTVPGDCSATGPALDTVASLEANGVLGIGPFAEDCGNACAGAQVVPATYYDCPTASTCVGATVGVDQQVVNPVAKFTLDNNGVVIELNTVPDAGASTVTGALVFGINTETNNTVAANVKVFSAQLSSVPQGPRAFVSTTFNNTVYPHAFFDTGSSATLFTDAALQPCAGAAAAFYCPASTFSSSASNSAVDPVTGVPLSGTSSTVSFSVDDASTLLAGSSGFAAFPTLGGPNPDPQGFEWGLPFFFNRVVYIGIAGRSSAAGVGPFFAY